MLNTTNATARAVSRKYGIDRVGSAYTMQGTDYWIKRVGSIWHTYHAAGGTMTRLVAMHPTLTAAAESLARIARTH
jgi:hypothetical protein